MADQEMFSHLNFKLDLANNKVVAETAAKDYHGKPLYQLDFDSYGKAKSAIESKSEEIQAAVATYPSMIPSNQEEVKAQLDNIIQDETLAEAASVLISNEVE